MKLQAEAFLQSLQASMENEGVLNESQLEISKRATRTLARDASVNAEQLARCRKATGDAFNAKEAMGTCDCVRGLYVNGAGGTQGPNKRLRQNVRQGLGRYGAGMLSSGHPKYSLGCYLEPGPA